MRHSIPYMVGYCVVRALPMTIFGHALKRTWCPCHKESRFCSIVVIMLSFYSYSRLRSERERDKAWEDLLCQLFKSLHLRDAKDDVPHGSGYFEWACPVHWGRRRCGCSRQGIGQKVGHECLRHNSAHSLPRRSYHAFDGKHVARGYAPTRRCNALYPIRC